MLWEVEIAPRGRDGERNRVCGEFDLLTHSQRGAELVLSTTRGYLLEGDVQEEAARRLLDELLVDSILESSILSPMGKKLNIPAVTVLLKPGVMDPSAQSVLDALATGGFHGTTDSKTLEVKEGSGATKGKVKAVTLVGVVEVKK